MRTQPYSVKPDGLAPAARLALGDTYLVSLPDGTSPGFQLLAAVGLAMRALQAKAPVTVRTEEGETILRYNGRDTPYPLDPAFAEAIAELEYFEVNSYNKGVADAVARLTAQGSELPRSPDSD